MWFMQHQAVMSNPEPHPWPWQGQTCTAGRCCRNAVLQVLGLPTTPHPCSMKSLCMCSCILTIPSQGHGD